MGVDGAEEVEALRMICVSRLIAGLVPAAAEDDGRDGAADVDAFRVACARKVLAGGEPASAVPGEGEEDVDEVYERISGEVAAAKVRLRPASTPRLDRIRSRAFVIIKSEHRISERNNTTYWFRWPS